MEAFDYLPLACIINDKFISLHEGISPDLKRIEDLNLIKRFKEPPKNGLICDILCNDHIDKNEETKNIFILPNKMRNCSYIFGTKTTRPFLEKGKYISIIRDPQLEGFKMHQ